MKRKALIVAVLMIGALSFNSCKKGGGSSGSPPATPVGVGPAGGTVNGPDSSQIIVPAGALSTFVDIQIAKNPAGAPVLPGSIASAGSVFAATPHGTVFAAPVALRIPFDPALVPAGATPKLYKAEPGGTFSEMANVTVNGGFLFVTATSFSYFAPGFAPPSQVGAQTFALGTNLRPTGIAAYPSGGAVAVGLSSGQVFVTKVAQNGTIEWSHTTQGEVTFLQSIPRVAVGPTGNVFVAATTTLDENGASLNGPSQVRVTAFNPNGTVRGGWPKRVSVNYDNWPNAMTTDSQDNVYVYGTSSSSNFQYHDGFRPFLASFTGGGTPIGTVGTVNFGGTEPSRRILAESIGIDSAGVLYLTARAIGFANLIDNGTGVRLLALNLMGNTVDGYPKRLSEDMPAHGAPLGISPDGIVYVLGTQLYAVNPNGSTVAGFPKNPPVPGAGDFSFNMDEPPNLVVSVTGNLYYSGMATGQPNNLGSDDVFGQSLNRDGAQRSGFPVYVGTSDTDYPVGVAIDLSGGNLWVLWYSDGNPAVASVTRFNAN